MRKRRINKQDRRGGDRFFGNVTVGERYRLLSRDEKALNGVREVSRMRAIDAYTGKSVVLHIYSADDNEKLMREADVVSALETVGDGRTYYAAVPTLVDAHIADDVADYFGYLVYSCDSGTVTLGEYLADADADAEVAYSALLGAVNTLIYAADMGIFHGLLSERTITIRRDADDLSYAVQGFGVYGDISFDDDAERVLDLLSRIDRCVGTKARRRSRKRRYILSALQTLKRVKLQSHLSQTSENVRKIRKKERSATVGSPKYRTAFARAASVVCFLCFAVLLSGYIMLDAKLFGTDTPRTVDIPSLVGLVYGGYDAENNVYVLTDGEGSEIQLDADIFDISVSGSDEYRDFQFQQSFDILNELSFAKGAVNGTVLRQFPAASQTRKATPGKNKAIIGITVLRDRNVSGTEVDLESLGIFGLDIEYVESLLSRYNITVDRTVRYNKSIPKGTVYSVSEGSSGARIGGTVRLYVSGGEA